MSEPKLQDLFSKGLKFKGGRRVKIKTHKPEKLDRILHGTGLTKRVARNAAVTEFADSAVDSATARTELLDKIGSIPAQLRSSDIILDESQQEAVDGLVEADYGCLIGPAGSGKTTTEKELLEGLGVTEAKYTVSEHKWFTAKSDNKAMLAFKKSCSLACVAYTGRAVQQMKRNLPVWLHPYCDTSHGWLGYAPEYVERINDAGELVTVRIFRPTFNRHNQLSSLDILVVDEAGMMPVYLWNQLMAAIPAHTRIFCVGDINQLAPVHGRSVLGFAMLKWPTFELRKVHRTDEGSIIDNAHRILHGKRIVADKKTTAKRVISSSPTEASIEVCTILKHLYDKGRFDPMLDVLITPTNVGMLGQENLNSHLVRIFNPVRYEYGVPINPRTTIRTARESVVYSVGDKVMLLKNKRDLGLTNGQVGVVMEIRRNHDFQGETLGDITFGSNGDSSFSLTADDIASLDVDTVEVSVQETDDLTARAASHVMVVKFQDVPEPLELRSTGDFSGITHAYAMTCHKMQGSEARKVIVIVHSAQLRMLCREWYYTAVTRAQERLIVLYTERGERHAVTAQRLKGNTLEEKALSFIEASGKDDNGLPELRVG